MFNQALFLESSYTYSYTLTLSIFSSHFRVLYNSSNGPSEAVVVKVLYDTEMQPHYNIKLASGDEKQTESNKLDKKKVKGGKEGATDENGDAPSNSVVDFRSNPTPLFTSLYQSKWAEALERLESHPEEANIWVARYATNNSNSGPDNSDEKELASSCCVVRWQLLPLHLVVALCGRSVDDATQDVDEDDVPEDEQDEIEQMEKENSKGDVRTPPMVLLSALLSANPKATLCTDDQSMIPLHSAIRGNSSLQVIQKLLDTYPSSVYIKDARGRNAFALVEKVFGKRLHNKQVGSEEEEARETKYAKLVNLLTNAAKHVASSTVPHQKEEEKTEPKQVPNATQKRMLQLQTENLALRKDNAMLKHRGEINARLLQQLVDKLQFYEEQRSIDIENYNDIFGSKDEIVERRDEILLSISEDGEEGNEAEDTQVCGDGAYHKRLNRYLHSTPTRNKGSINVISPASAMTEATELSTPPTPQATPSVLIPQLESKDEDDNKETSDAEGDKNVVETHEGQDEEDDSTPPTTTPGAPSVTVLLPELESENLDDVVKERSEAGENEDETKTDEERNAEDVSTLPSPASQSLTPSEDGENKDTSETEEVADQVESDSSDSSDANKSPPKVDQGIFRKRGSNASEGERTPSEMAQDLDELVRDISAAAKTEIVRQNSSDVSTPGGKVFIPGKVSGMAKVFESMNLNKRDTEEQHATTEKCGASSDNEPVILNALSQEEEDQLLVE